MEILNLNIIIPWLIVALTGITALLIDLFLPYDEKGPVLIEVGSLSLARLTKPLKRVGD